MRKLAAPLSLLLLALPLLASPLACVRMQEAPPARADGESCTVDSDCESTSRCTAGMCWAQGGCAYGEYTSSCAADQVCNYGTCTLRECEPLATPSACGAYACYNYLCRTYCSYDEDCSAGNVCRAGACVSGYCTAENAASVCKGTACDTATGQCYDSYDCETVGCAATYVCDGLWCNKPCSTDTECAPFVCDYDNQCSDSCYDNEGCADGYRCINSMCVANTQ